MTLRVFCLFFFFLFSQRCDLLYCHFLPKGANQIVQFDYFFVFVCFHCVSYPICGLQELHELNVPSEEAPLRFLSFPEPRETKV